MATRFVSKYPALHMVIQPADVKEVDGKVIRVKGLYADFKDGAYETDDQKIIDKIKSSNMFGMKVFIDVPDEKVEKKIQKAQAAVVVEEKEVPAKKKGKKKIIK